MFENSLKFSGVRERTPGPATRPTPQVFPPPNQNPGYAHAYWFCFSLSEIIRSSIRRHSFYVIISPLMQKQSFPIDFLPFLFSFHFILHYYQACPTFLSICIIFNTHSSSALPVNFPDRRGFYSISQ